nr:hypothetical protein [Priestia koreensis]
MDKWENMSHDSSFQSACEPRDKRNYYFNEQAKLANARQRAMERVVEEVKIQLIRKHVCE